MQVSPNFSLSEFTRSDTAVRKGIDNTPGAAELANIKALCLHILEPVRTKTQAPITISSGYRCRDLNRLIGGSRNSQHIEGKAADIYVHGYSAEELFQFIKRNILEYDQLIQEFDNWVHVSWNGFNNRNQCLRATKISGKTIYTAA